MLRGEAAAEELTGVPRSDATSGQAPDASQPSTRPVTPNDTTTATNPQPLPEIDADRPSGQPVRPARPSPNGFVPGVAPNEVQRALDAGAGAGGVSLPRAAENAASQVQLQQGPTTGDVELLMKLFRIENEPVKIYGWLENSYTQNTNGRPHNDSNFSVFPNRGANQWQGNQYYFIVELGSVSYTIQRRNS
jgi:hypothetical protein